MDLEIFNGHFRHKKTFMKNSIVVYGNFLFEKSKNIHFLCIIQIRVHDRQLPDWRFHIRHNCRYVVHGVAASISIIVGGRGVYRYHFFPGQVGNVITNRNANRLEFERLLDGAKLYMRHHKVPSGMKKRVLRWYDYSWSR